MSYLARSSRTLLRPSRTFTSAFHTSRPRYALSESDHAKDVPDRAAKIDEHKHDSVNKAKKGSGEWNPELASNSEQGVRADKHNMSMDEMQKQGSSKAEQGKEPARDEARK